MRKGMWLIGGLTAVITGSFFALRWAERDGKFDLISARIDNAGPVDSALVADVLEPFFGESLLSLNTDSIEGCLLDLEGMKTASVSFIYPGSMIVALEPEVPVAIVDQESESYPVTVTGKPLPADWTDEALPVLLVTGAPDEIFISSGIDLLVKRGLGGRASVLVGETGVTVIDDGVPVVLDGSNAAADWVTWESMKNSVNDPGCTVDLRFNGQAIIIPGEESEV